MSRSVADTKHGVTPDEEVATRTGFEPVISAVTGQRVNRYTNGPLNPPRDENPRSNPEDFSGDVENRSLLIANSTGSDHGFQSPSQFLIDQASYKSPERDGCGCPPWVVRCCHFDGKVLQLARRHNPNVCPLSSPDDERLGVRFADVTKPCPICGQQCAVWDAHGYLGFSEADALVAFYAAEAELLNEARDD